MCNKKRSEKKDVFGLKALLDLQDAMNPKIQILDAIYFQLADIISKLSRDDVAPINAEKVMNELKMLWFKYDEVYFDVRNMGHGYYAKMLDELYYYIKGLAVDLDEYIYYLGAKEVRNDLKSLWERYDNVYEDLKDMVSWYS